MTTPSDTLVVKLRADADLLDAWEHFELGTEPPAPMHYAKVAAGLREAADTIDRLTSTGEAVERGPTVNSEAFQRDLAQGVISRLVRLTVGNCSCGVKSPELNYHAESCNYRLASEALDLARALYASPREGHVEVPTHRHKKRGSEYVLLGIGKMQAENWTMPHQTTDQYGKPMECVNTVDMQEVAIYRSVDDGSLWARPRDEFEDGRFESLPHNRGETK